MDGEFYVESKNTTKVRSDRYRNCNILEDKDEHISLLATREVNTIRSNPNDVYHTLKSHECNRLDIIAHTYYKNPLLWWVIAQANDIADPFSPMEPGTVLRIPAIETLYGNNGILL